MSTIQLILNIRNMLNFTKRLVPVLPNVSLTSKEMIICLFPFDLAGDAGGDP